MALEPLAKTMQPAAYARHAEHDGRQMRGIGNPVELGQRVLAGVLRMEDLLERGVLAVERIATALEADPPKRGRPPKDA